MTEDIRQDEVQQETAESQSTPPQEELSEEARELKEAIEAGDFDISEFLAQYKAAQTEKEEAEARALRVQADFDNFRRRSRKDQEEAGKRAQGDLLLELLPIVDNFERALKLMTDGADKEGVDLICKQLNSVLSNAGLVEIEALGADFDPNLHQAVLQEESADQKGKVLMVLQKGYLHGERLLRPAMVQVGV